MRALACLICLTAVTGVVFGQSSEPPAAFEAADVHVSTTKSPFPQMKGPMFRGGLYDIGTATMVDMISTAYGVPAEKVLGGPSWLEMDRFDAIGKVPEKSTPDSRKAMLQALLADRFKLVVHHDTRPMPAYALSAGKRPTLKKADDTGETGCKFIAPSGPESGPPSTISYKCRNMTMEAFAAGLLDMMGGFRFNNSGNVTVVDQTKLEGKWNFDLEYSPPGLRAAAAQGETITLFDAVEKQLGLKLEASQMPLPVLVVDSVNRTPTDNLPGVSGLLHIAPVPTEFEVAEVKPSDPDFRGMRFNIQPGGRVNIQGVTLKFLMQQLFDFPDEDRIVGAPKWMDQDRFDIIAKASSDVVSGGAGGQRMDIDIDAVIAMVQTLVKDRFKMVSHIEERPVNAYSLIAVKPRMKKADPNSRTLFKEGTPTLDAKDPRNSNPMLARLVTVQNMTMAQFADKLRNIAPGYIHSPVMDATGLEGSWDFTLSFTPMGMGRTGGGRGGDGGRGGAAPAAGVTTDASEPDGSITLPEAIEKQLGLKLVMGKRPLPVLVIDHIDQKPEN